MRARPAGEACSCASKRAELAVDVLDRRVGLGAPRAVLVLGVVELERVHQHEVGDARVAARSARSRTALASLDVRRRQLASTARASRSRPRRTRPASTARAAASDRRAPPARQYSGTSVEACAPTVTGHVISAAVRCAASTAWYIVGTAMSSAYQRQPSKFLPSGSSGLLRHDAVDPRRDTGDHRRVRRGR